MKHKDVVFRSVNHCDLPALRDLFLRSRRAAFHWKLPSSLALGDFDIQTEGELQMVALNSERHVGFISIWEPNNFIHHLHVDPRFLRQGIGQALLSALPEWKMVPYRLKCVSANEAAVAFYLSNGFFLVGEGRADEQDYLLLESSLNR